MLSYSTIIKLVKRILLRPVPTFLEIRDVLVRLKKSLRMKLKELLLILCVSRVVLSGPFFPMDQCECGKTIDASSARILGGNETKRGEFPWTVGLFQVFNFTKGLFINDVTLFWTIIGLTVKF